MNRENRNIPMGGREELEALNRLLKFLNASAARGYDEILPGTQIEELADFGITGELLAECVRGAFGDRDVDPAAFEQGWDVAELAWQIWTEQVVDHPGFARKPRISIRG